MNETMQSLFARVIERTMPIPHSGCLIYLGNLDDNGYGRIVDKRRIYKVHRLLYELSVGPIPDGLVIDHKCRVKSCCNPAHLEPVTIAENVARGVRWPAEKPTLCPRGHPYTRSGRVERVCLVCNKLRARERRKENRRLGIKDPPRGSKHRVLTERLCPICGDIFCVTTDQPLKKFCSRPCFWQAQRDRAAVAGEREAT